MELEYVKSIAAFVLCVVTLLCTMLPLLLLRNVRRVHGEFTRPIYTRIISLLSCFGGGIFLGTCLLDLFPDVQEQMHTVFKNNNFDSKYPVAEFLLAFGFLTVLVTEQIVLNCQQGNEERSPLLSHQHSHQGDAQRTDSYGAIDNNIQQDNHNTSFHQDLSSHSVLRSVLLVFALSLHSVFEGLAIGLQPSTENVVRILLAVLIHKSVIAFTLGLNLAHSRLKRSDMIRCNTLFSIMSPIGIIVGLLVVDLGQGQCIGITSGILQGLAAGTFLYVTFFEILPHELNSNEDKMLKMTFLLLGFSVISLLIAYFPS